MLAIIFWIGVTLLRWAFIAACVAAYVQVGPGGDSLGNVVEAIKSVLLSIDWEVLARNVAMELENVAKAIFDNLFVRAEE